MDHICPKCFTISKDTIKHQPWCPEHPIKNLEPFAGMEDINDLFEKLNIFK